MNSRGLLLSGGLFGPDAVESTKATETPHVKLLLTLTHIRIGTMNTLFGLRR